jgi:hypothetical protein
MVALYQNDFGAATRHFLDYFKLTGKPLNNITICDFLISAAAITAGRNQPERAAKLYGAAQAFFERTGYVIQPFDQTEFDLHLQIARNQLGDARFEELAAEGASLALEDAVAAALECLSG